MPNNKSLINRRFGLLRVIRPASILEIPSASDSDIHKYWILLCQCGKEKVLHEINFKYRRVRCGCKPTNSLPLGEASKNQAFYLMKRAVKAGTGRHGKRRIHWALSRAEFLAITSKPCVYCGVLWSKETGKGRSFGTYKYNGIDRIDSTKGYVLGNCAPACRRCNEAKNDRTVEEFKAWLCQIYNHYIVKDEYAKA